MSAFESDLSELALQSRGAPFDAIVVGGGSAGMTSVRTLFETGLRVILLEAGPARFLTHVSNTELRFARQLLRSLRGRVEYSPELASGGRFGSNYGCLGGRGLFWNGAAPRYSAGDLRGWPIVASDLAEGYEWAEAEFRVTTRMGQTALARFMIERFHEAGLEAEPGPFAIDMGGPAPGRLSAGIASGFGLFLRGCGDAAASGKVRVAVDSLVRRVLHQGGEVRGVAVSPTRGGEPVEIEGRSVLLAGGGIESIKLAALSEVPDPAGRIGVGLQEHIFYHCLFSGPHLYDPATPDSAVVFVRAPRQDAHQWEIHAPGERLFGIDDGSAWHPDGNVGYQIMARSFAANEKRDANRVEARDGLLGSSRIHFAPSEADQATKARILEDAGRVAEALELEAVGGIAVDSPDRFRALGSSYHDAGGLDMGTDPAHSVTDPDGCFHACPSLLSVDAAAFPRIGATNPHLTIVALARRKAARLARRLA